MARSTSGEVAGLSSRLEGIVTPTGHYWKHMSYGVSGSTPPLVKGRASLSRERCTAFWGTYAVYRRKSRVAHGSGGFECPLGQPIPGEIFSLHLFDSPESTE